MNKLIFLTVLLYNSFILSFDKFLDINLVTDFSSLKERSHIDFNSQAVVPFSNQAFLLSPRFSIFFDGSMDVSLATGFRHQTPFGTLGQHVFWDSTGTKDAHFHQIGHSLDFITENFDYRLNYYHPITKQQASEQFLFSTHRWAESEIVYKSNVMQIGVGPKYDIFDKLWGVQGKIILPFEPFNIGALINYDSKNKCSCAMSLSFRLYGSPRKNAMESPIHHQSRVHYSKDLIFMPVTSPSEEIVATDVIEDEEAAKSSWWDFFFQRTKK